MATAPTPQSEGVLLSWTGDEEHGLAEMQLEAPRPRQAVRVARRLALALAAFVALGVAGYALSAAPREVRALDESRRLTGTSCEHFPHIKVKQLLTNSLEDPSVGIVFQGVYSNPLTDEDDVEVEIRMRSDSYSAEHQGRNGVINDFITIWMNSNSEAEISTEILSKETGHPVEVTEIAWTFFDIDSEDGFDDLCEEVAVQPVNEAMHYDRVRVVGSGDVATTGLLKVRSTGGQEAEPTRADELTAATAARRAAQATFFDASRMTIHLKTGDCGGRKFMMAAMPIVECATTPDGAPR